MFMLRLGHGIYGMIFMIFMFTSEPKTFHVRAVEPMNGYYDCSSLHLWDMGPLLGGSSYIGSSLYPQL